MGLKYFGLILLLGILTKADPDQFCNRIPSESRAYKSPGDNGFRITVSTGTKSSDTYTPEQVYTVTINGTLSQQKFLGFMLVAVSQNAVDENITIGTFQNIDHHLTKFSETCPHIVTDRYPGIFTQTDSFSKIKPYGKKGISLLWVAPKSGAGCVEFRATVLELRDIWYKDDGALTKTLCEESSSVRPTTRAPPTECCACGTPKYELVFTGKWNRRNHPKDFPSGHNLHLIHWSNLIGASHTKDYHVWNYGRVASEGVKWVCEFGSPAKLEQEFKEHHNDVRSVIGSRGLWGIDNMEKPMRSYFSVSPKKHLVSFLTMIGPSPDWCVGLSEVNLCLPNCTWAGNQVFDLYPWDAGTDTGVSYAAPNSRAKHPDVIRPLTNQWPANPQSPFYGNEPVKPFGKVHIRRLSPNTSPRQCDGKEEENTPISGGRRVAEKTRKKKKNKGKKNKNRKNRNRNKNKGRHNDDPQVTKEMMMKKALMEKCPLSTWGDWSQCSVTCGKGIRVRFRKFLKQVDTEVCTMEVMEKETCLGFENICDRDSDCAVTNWSDWAPCSVTCGKGVQERTRMFIRPNKAVSCEAPLKEMQMCIAEIMDCAKAEMMIDYTEICALKKERGRCRASFTRYYYNTQMSKCLPFVYGGCRGNKNNFETIEECSQKCETAMKQKEMAMRKKQEMMRQQAQQAQESTKMPPVERARWMQICSAPKVSGPCRAKQQRWYFDTTMKKCLPFTYGGCDGNHNRFRTMKQCTERCVAVMDEMLYAMMLSKQVMTLLGTHVTSGSSVQNTEPVSLQPTTPTAFTSVTTAPPETTSAVVPTTPTVSVNQSGPRLDCMVTPWTEFSACSATCGKAHMTRTRMIKVEPQYGGEPCPKKLKQRRRCKKLPKCTDPSPLVVDCMLGEWGEWSACSKTCGDDSIRERTKMIKRQEQNGGKPCIPEIDRQICVLTQC